MKKQCFYAHFCMGVPRSTLFLLLWEIYQLFSSQWFGSHPRISATPGNRRVGISTTRISWMKITGMLFFQSKIGARVHQKRCDQMLGGQKSRWPIYVAILEFPSMAWISTLSSILTPPPWPICMDILESPLPLKNNLDFSVVPAMTLFFLEGERGQYLDRKVKFGGCFQGCPFQQFSGWRELVAWCNQGDKTPLGARISLSSLGMESMSSSGPQRQRQRAEGVVAMMALQTRCSEPFKPDVLNPSDQMFRIQHQTVSVCLGIAASYT